MQMPTDLQAGVGALEVFTSNHITITIFLPLFFSKKKFKHWEMA